jgi:hypothetical protein
LKNDKLLYVSQKWTAKCKTSKYINRSWIVDMPNKNSKNSLPLWQSEKMRNIIESQWEEIWEIVISRDRFLKNSHRYLESPQRNCHF